MKHESVFSSGKIWNSQIYFLFMIHTFIAEIFYDLNYRTFTVVSGLFCRYYYAIICGFRESYIANFNIYSERFGGRSTQTTYYYITKQE